MEKFLVNDVVEYCGLEGKVTECYTNDDGLACIDVLFSDGESESFLEDGRLDTRFKKAVLTLTSRPATPKTFYVNIYKKPGTGTLVPGSKLFDSKEYAAMKGKSSSDMLYVNTVSILLTV